MGKFIKDLEGHLIDLVWSLWDELGVAGVDRKHQQTLIQLEELILCTSVIGELDPRLREEALDWCSQFYSYVSVSRLKTLAKSLGDLVDSPFSVFSETLNIHSKANWPVLKKIQPLKYKLSGKSESPDLRRPALLLLKSRSLFGVGARADLIVFFLVRNPHLFSIADTVEIGYTKRNLADMIDGFCKSGIFELSFERNQQKVRFAKQEDMKRLLGPLPKIIFPWRYYFEFILKLRSCLIQYEKKSVDTRVIEINNLFLREKYLLQQLNWTPPTIQANLDKYWMSLEKWIIEEMRKI